MRGAECNTDHQLLCVEVRLSGCRVHHKSSPRCGRFDVSQLVKNRRQSRRDGRDSSSQTCAAFQEDVAVRAGSMWPKDGTAEDK